MNREDLIPKLEQKAAHERGEIKWAVFLFIALAVFFTASVVLSFFRWYLAIPPLLVGLVVTRMFFVTPAPFFFFTGEELIELYVLLGNERITNYVQVPVTVTDFFVDIEMEPETEIVLVELGRGFCLLKEDRHMSTRQALRLLKSR